MSATQVSISKPYSNASSYQFHQRIFIYIFVLLTLFVLVVTFLERDHRTLNTPERSQAKYPIALDDSLVFFSVGDWGRRGSEGQKKVAEAMAYYGSLVSPTAIISTGDNFYEEGITSPMPDGLNDTHFDESFKSVYCHESLRDIPWYIVAGNNDIKGHLEPMLEWKGDSRWNFPSRNYTITWEMPTPAKKHEDSDEKISSRLRIRSSQTRQAHRNSKGNGNLTVIFLDSSPYIEQYFENGQFALGLSNLEEFDRDGQLLWVRNSIIEAKRRSSTVVVVSHHPLYSPGKGGGSPELKSNFGDMFRELSVDLVLSGHIHLLAYSNDGAVEHVVSGGGSECEDGDVWEPENMWKWPGTGFVIHSFTTWQIRHSFIDGETGRVLFQKNSRLNV